MNRFQRALLGSGRLPDRIRAELAVDDVVVLEEGLVGSVTYRRYRAPGEWSSWSKEAVSGSVAVTARRLVVWAGRFRHIDVAMAHPVWATIEVTADRPERVCFAYDAGATNPSRSGRVEVRLRTTQAARIVELLTG